MELIVVLIVGAPIVLAIWLIVRAVSAKNRIEELTQRVDDLQSQVLRLTHRPPTASQTTEGTSPAFTPAVLSARKTYTEPVTTPSSIPAEPETMVPPVIAPPPIIPPLTPTAFPEPDLSPEPVLENAAIS